MATEWGLQYMTQKEMAAKFPIVNFNKTLIQIHEKVDQTSKYPSMKGILRLSRKQGCQGTCAPSCAKLVNQLGKICKTEVVKLVCKEGGGGYPPLLSNLQTL